MFLTRAANWHHLFNPATGYLAPAAAPPSITTPTPTPFRVVLLVDCSCGQYGDVYRVERTLRTTEVVCIASGPGSASTWVSTGSWSWSSAASSHSVWATAPRN